MLQWNLDHLFATNEVRLPSMQLMRHRVINHPLTEENQFKTLTTIGVVEATSLEISGVVSETMASPRKHNTKG